MITKIGFHNAFETLYFYLTPTPTPQEFILYNIEGFGDLQFNNSFGNPAAIGTGLDPASDTQGRLYNSVVATSQNQEHTFQIELNPISHTYSQLRNRLYSFANLTSDFPVLNQNGNGTPPIRISYWDGSSGTDVFVAERFCALSKVEPSIFTNFPSIDLTVSWDKPYFSGAPYTISGLGSTSVTINNPGNAVSPIALVIDITTPPSNLHILSVKDQLGRALSVQLNFASGDSVFIDSGVTRKDFKISGTNNFNLLGSIYQNDSYFPMVYPGTNTLTISTPTPATMSAGISHVFGNSWYWGF